MRKRINVTIRDDVLRKFSLDAEVIHDGRSRAIERMIEARICRKKMCPECGSKWDAKHNRCSVQCGESRGE